MPRPLAEALAVPLAAQLACTPIIALISGQVSLVAVAANMLAAPAVGPATVLGLLAGLVALVWADLAHLIGWGAAAMAWWIIEIAQRGATLPGASVEWSSGGWAVGVLILLCAAVGLALTRLLRYRLAVAALAAVVALWVVRPPSPGWPPDDWVLVACDVGQGDALVLNVGAGSAMVVDAGPDAALVDGCLDALEVDAIPLVVLTHQHADHIDGIAGVGDGRSVGVVAVGPGALDTSDYGPVTDWAEDQGVSVRELAYPSTGSVGALTWSVLGPDPTLAAAADSDEAANDASVVLSVRTNGVTILLTGDVEVAAQQALVARDPTALRADVLKVPHHGSADYDAEFLRVVGARLAVVSVGADNDYGHPAPTTLDALRDVGATTARTDELGDAAVVVRDGELEVVSR
jgi:competence protein ComEC